MSFHGAVPADLLAGPCYILCGHAQQMEGQGNGMLNELQGQTERATHTNEASGYAVAGAKVCGRRDLVTTMGNMKVLATAAKIFAETPEPFSFRTCWMG